MVSDQDKPPGIEQGSHTDRLADLRGFVHDAEVKAAASEEGMLDAHTGGSHNKLDGERRDWLPRSCRRHAGMFARFYMVCTITSLW